MSFSTPYILEVSIDDVSKILKGFPPEQSNILLRIVDSTKAVKGYNLRYCLFTADIEASQLPISGHSIGKTCVEMVIATEIHRRFSLLLKDVIAESDEKLRENKFLIYDQVSEVKLLKSEYTDLLFNLASIDFRYSELFDGIEVLSIALQSPFKIRSKIGTLIAALQLAFGPPAAATPEIAVQQAMVRAANIGNAINAATAIVNAAEAGYKLSVQWRTEGQAERLRYEIETGNYRNLQIVLAQRGLYSGRIDNLCGPQTELAVRTFALSIGLPLDTAKTDMRLLEALLEGIELPPSAASK